MIFLSILISFLAYPVYQGGYTLIRQQALAQKRRSLAERTKKNLFCIKTLFFLYIIKNFFSILNLCMHRQLTQSTSITFICTCHIGLLIYYLNMNRKATQSTSITFIYNSNLHSLLTLPLYEPVQTTHRLRVVLVCDRFERSNSLNSFFSRFS